MVNSQETTTEARGAYQKEKRHSMSTCIYGQQLLQQPLSALNQTCSYTHMNDSS